MIVLVSGHKQKKSKQFTRATDGMQVQEGASFCFLGQMKQSAQYIHTRLSQRPVCKCTG